MERKPFTKEDDAFILKCFDNNSIKSKAINEASKKLNRSYQSIYMRHLRISNNEDIPKLKSKSHKFTEKDDQMIIDHIKETPTNIQEGLKRAAKDIGIQIQSVSSRYYCKLKNNPKYLAITCGSKAGFTHNVKNVLRDKKTGQLPDQNLRHYMVIMKQLLELSPKERKKILGFFED